MAVSPVLLKSLPFDAKLDHTLKFTQSGSQVFAHRVVIKNTETNEIVYDKKTENDMVLSAKIPANTLVNGNTYSFQVSVFDHENIESGLSNYIIAKCLATPVFEFANVTDSMIVRNSQLDVELSYSQENGELLNAYTITLYAANQTTVVYSTGVRYVDGALTARIIGLMDDTTYQLYATGETVNGMEMEIDLVPIGCDYIKPDVFLKFRADNIAEEGSVRLSSNYVLIEGKTDAESLVYIDDEKISLLNGEKVWFGDGYSASNFYLEAIISNIPDFASIISFNMKNVIATLSWNWGYFSESEEKMYYAELIAYQYVGTEKVSQLIWSNRIEPIAEGEQIHFYIRHVDGAFDLIVTKLANEETTEEGGESV